MIKSKLLIPDIKFSTLNLRDEAQERAFIAQLKTMGVPTSDNSGGVWERGDDSAK